MSKSEGNRNGDNMSHGPRVLSCSKKKWSANRSLLAFVVYALVLINVAFASNPGVARADTCPGAGSIIYLPQRDAEFLVTGVVQQPVFQDGLAVWLSMDERMSTLGWRRAAGSTGSNIYVWANFFPQGDEFQLRVAQVTAYTAGYPGSLCYYSCVVTVGSLPPSPTNTPNPDPGAPTCPQVPLN